MALTTATLNALCDEMALLATHVSLHTADPGATGINESTAARQAASWAAGASGNLSLSVAENFTGGAASGPCTHIGLWSDVAAGTFRGGYALTGDQAFNAAGEYSVTDIDITLTPA